MSKKFTITEGSTMQSCVDCRNPPTKEITATRQFMFIKRDERRPFCDTHAEQERLSLLNQGFIFDRQAREVVQEKRDLPPPQALPRAPVEAKQPIKEQPPVDTSKRQVDNEPQKVLIKIEIDVKNQEPETIIVKKTITKKKKTLEPEREI